MIEIIKKMNLFLADEWWIFVYLSVDHRFKYIHFKVDEKQQLWPWKLNSKFKIICMQRRVSLTSLCWPIDTYLQFYIAMFSFKFAKKPSIFPRYFFLIRSYHERFLRCMYDGLNIQPWHASCRIHKRHSVRLFEGGN